MHSTNPVLFLFDSNHPEAGNVYGDRFDLAFLRALKASDKKRLTRSRVLRGDLPLWSLCYKPSHVSAMKESSTVEVSADTRFYMLLTGDLCDAFEDQIHTLNVSELASSLVQRHTLTCIFLPSFPSKLRSKVDNLLRKHPYYLGSVVLDLSNPLQFQLSVQSLIEDTFIEGGTVHVVRGSDGYIEADFRGAEQFSNQGIVALSSDEFSKRMPPMPTVGKLSVRAMVTLMRMKNRGKLNVHERLATQLQHQVWRGKSAADFDWDLKQLPDAPDEVEVQAQKITNYLLNEKHEKGKSKAKFFNQELAISPDDWLYLHGQFIDALNKEPFKDIQLGNFGIKFCALLPIKGRNGRSAIVKTVWIVRPGERASLVTAYPAGSESGGTSDAEDPVVVPSQLKGHDRWKAIFLLARKAGAEAAAKCVPTPMKISGGEIFMEGECGGAYVMVPDARRGFARWLKTNGYGRRGLQGGVCFYSKVKSQSVDRATAYAEEFSRVLRRNGIDCTVSKYLT